MPAGSLLKCNSTDVNLRHLPSGQRQILKLPQSEKCSRFTKLNELQQEENEVIEIHHAK